jgi:3'(2'), 5'-bisphosphate nucleotidase
LPDRTDDLLALADRAGAAILALYEAGPGRVAAKGDGSPVTAADAAAEAVILEGLARLAPGERVVAEERFSADGVACTDTAFWLVDPLDGTREYIARNGEFTVNIARVQRGLPVFGIVHAPALGLTWWGAAGQGAWMKIGGGAPSPIRARPAPADGLVVAASRSHGDGGRLDAFLARWTVRERLALGSSLKFCRIAEGAVDLYPRFGPTMEWDTAAADAVLRAAGGIVVEAATGTPLAYGKPGHRNGEFVAYGAWGPAVGSHEAVG